MKYCVVLGFGAVGQRCAELITMKKVFGDRIRIVGVADSSAGVYDVHGVDLKSILKWKREKKSLRGFKDGYDKSSHVNVRDSEELFEVARKKHLDVVIDLAPCGNRVTPKILKSALRNGIDCVLANKSPLATEFYELHNLARSHNANLAYSATICGGLPVANVASRDLVGSTLESIEGIFNSTSNFILSEMRQGRSREDALKEAQRRGIAEADPSLDIQGLDTANKLVILANTMNIRADMDSVNITGIEKIQESHIQEAEKRGNVIRLVASLQRKDNGTYVFSVRPVEVKINSYLGSCNGTSMCVQFRTDIFETISMMTDEKGVYPTSAAVLRDILSL